MDAEQLLALITARLPDFILEKQLGAGGMGLVLLGTQRELSRKVAIKILFVDRADPRDIARFKREAQMYAQLTHPNLVKVYDAEATGTPPYIVLEYIRGRDLKETINAGDAPRLERIAGPLASSLAYVHERGIWHRDIKAANVMLRENGSPVLMDFGLAKREDVNATALTEDGARVGTPLYMPPEILLGKGEASAAGDVYMLGLTLYEVAAGRTMGALDCGTVSVVQRATKGMPRLADIGAAVDEEIEKLIQSAIALNPEDRPTAQQLADELMARCAGQTFSEEAAPTLVGDPPAGLASGARLKRSGAAVAPGELTRRQSKPLRRSGALASVPASASAPGADARLGPRVALAAAAIGVVVLGVLWSVRGRPSPSPTPAPASAPIVVREPASAAALEPQRTGKHGETMVLVPAGFFTMGSRTKEYPREQPPHRVYLDAYYIGKTEVTNELYDRFCRETGHKPRERYTRQSPELDRPDHPAVGVTWHGAAAYAVWAGQRLPTEAEWEKAARGTDNRRFPWGDELPSKHCNFADMDTTGEIFGDDVGKASKFLSSDGFSFTSPVGHFPKGASPFGALDMAGNASEWCADWYSEDYYQYSPARAPKGAPSGKTRVTRGGNWENLERSIRTSHRECEPPDGATFKIGFRTVLDP